MQARQILYYPLSVRGTVKHGRSFDIKIYWQTAPNIGPELKVKLVLHTDKWEYKIVYFRLTMEDQKNVKQARI